MSIEDIKKMLLNSGGNYIGNINFIEKVEGENIYLSGDKPEDNQKKTVLEPAKGKLSDTSISDDIIPEKLKSTYRMLSPHRQLLCQAIVLLQNEKEANKDLFCFSNDWWGVYSPLVYDEGLLKDPGSFYTLMQEIGMGHFKVNCSREQMVDINGVFLKDYRIWNENEYLNGYGERLWAFWHKKKIALRMANILIQLHEERGI